MKIFITFLIWMLNVAFKNQDSKSRKQLEPCINELYRRMATENFKVKEVIVKVKKGRRRYDLMFVETNQGVIRFNLGRHGDAWQGEIPLDNPYGIKNKK